MCILIVEREPVSLMVAVEVLREAGHDVKTAQDASGALQLLVDHPAHFSCLVTDFEMSAGPTGAQLIEHMRGLYPSIPMVLATGLSWAVTPDWRSEQNVELLHKPYATTGLLEVVERLLARAEGPGS